VVNRVVAAIGQNTYDLGLAGRSSLWVLDAVGFSGVVAVEFGATDDDFDVGCLVEALRFAGSKAADHALDCDVSVRSSDGAGGWVVGARCGGFDVGDVDAPVREDLGRYCAECVVNQCHISPAVTSRCSWSLQLGCRRR